MKNKTELNKVFIAELISLEDQSKIFGGIIEFPVIYLNTLQIRYLKDKEITVLYLPDTELEYYTSEKILESLELTFEFTNTTLLAADPVMYVRIVTLLKKENVRRLFFGKIEDRRCISSLKISNFFSFLDVVEAFKQKQELIPAVSNITKLTRAYDYAHIEPIELN